MAYTLVIAEKPNAAKRIAEAIGKAKEIRKGKVRYWEVSWNGKQVLVVPAVGHLFILSEPGGRWVYPVFKVEWKPVFEIEKEAGWTRPYFKLIQELAKGAEEFIAATDFDLEGSVIAYNILRFICGTERAKRMKFSTLTSQELREAFERPLPELDWPQVFAGLTRHELDFYWGINLSRALTLALKSAGGWKTLSIGRVQGPTLYLLFKRQAEIESFEPKPYWQIQLHANGILALHEKERFWEKAEAEAVLKKCLGQQAEIKDVKEKKEKILQPHPFNLTDLQREAYNLFGYSPKLTLDLAQSLYEQALISYPRTSSQKLPERIGYGEIIKKLSGQGEYKEIAEKLLKGKLKPREGPKTDPAHPAIYPTGEKPKALTQAQKRVYDLIVRRFLATFNEPAERLSLQLRLGVSGEIFKAKGYKLLKPGWLESYKYAKVKEAELPEVKPGQKLSAKLELLEKQTQPPQRYTQASILKEMEKQGLGTKGTRALILQTLYDRGYIIEKSIHVTGLGKTIVKALETYCPDILSVELTRHFESELDAIQQKNKRPEEILREAREKLERILERFREKEEEIGKTLLEAVRRLRREQSLLGDCKCGGELVIKRAKNGKRFVACTKWPECRESYNLPRKGKITITREKCQCGLYILKIKQAGKREWKLCVRCGFKP